MALPPRSITMRWAMTLVALALLVAPAAAQRLRQITAFDVYHLDNFAVDDAGSVAFFVSDVDPLGTNPGFVMQVFKKTLPGGLPVQVTTLEADAFSVSVGDDGGTILFGSGADSLGTNADGSPELFLADGDGGSMVQLTDHPAGVGVYEAVLSGDGTTALFVSDGDLTGQNPSLVSQLFAMDTSGSNLRQLTSASGIGVTDHLAISDDGQRIAFVDYRDLTGENPDGSPELFAVAGDGTGLTQVTSNASVGSAAIAGLGTLVAYVDYPDLRYVNWGSSKSTFLADSVYEVSVTDSGDRIYYRSWGDEIYRIDMDEGTRKPGDPPARSKCGSPRTTRESPSFPAQGPVSSSHCSARPRPS